MNKSCLHAALVGLLLALMTPGLAYANTQAGGGGGKIIRSLLVPRKQQAAAFKYLSAMESNLAPSVKEKVLTTGVNVSSLKFIPPSYIKYPDLVNSRRDIAEFMNMMDRNFNLDVITPTTLATQAVLSDSERWVVFSLNHGADPVETLKKTVVYNRPEMADKLMTTYGINPNGTSFKGEPMLFSLPSLDEIPNWFLYRDDVNWNVSFNGEPLIFNTLRTPYMRHNFGTLIPRIDPFLTNANGETPFHLASTVVTLEKALPVGYEIPTEILNKPDNNGNTPLHWAASTGNLANYKYLIGKGAKPTLPNRWGETPIGILTQKMAQISGLPNAQSLGTMVNQSVALPKARP